MSAPGGVGITPLGVEVVERIRRMIADGTVREEDADDALLARVAAEVRAERGPESGVLPTPAGVPDALLAEDPGEPEFAVLTISPPETVDDLEAAEAKHAAGVLRTVFDPVPEGDREALLDVYRSNGYDSVDLVESYAALAPVTKGETVAVLRNIAPQAARVGARRLLDVASSLKDAVRRGDVEHPAEAELFAGHEPAANVVPKARRTRDGKGVVVEGGHRSGPLPPERGLDGAPDPEVGRMVAAGRSRYHLDTLRELEDGSRVELDLGEDRSAEHSAALLPILQAGVEEMMRAAGISGPPPAVSFGAPPAEPLDPIEAARMREVGREMARAVLGSSADAEGALARADAAMAHVEVPAEPGCGSAGCRTLEECLCRCRKCRTTCATRRRG